MANVFDKILKMSSVEIKQNSEASIDWFRQKATGQRVTGNQLLTAGDYRDNITNFVAPGGMYFFQYDAKHKETLPYWDKYPLIFPFEMKPDGFLGLNLHYLPPTMRASLMSNLSNRKARTKAEDISISYKILSSYANLRYFKPLLSRQVAVPLHPSRRVAHRYIPTSSEVPEGERRQSLRRFKKDSKVIRWQI